MGSYRPVEPVGRGGMGEIWRAERRMLAHLAAIKLIRPEALCCDSDEALADGLVHRAIKPRNILLCRLGFNFDFIKELDFGLVKADMSQTQTRLTADGVTTGTPAFPAH